jgi:hypothetical protein
MKARLNKTGNTQGEPIIIMKMIDPDGTMVEQRGRYVSIDNKGYICWINTDGEHRWTDYKMCYRETAEYLF